MQIVNPEAETYASNFSSKEPELLAEINAYTYSTHAQPHMLSGHTQGKFLDMVSKLLKPSRILEIGTFTGYSALCLAGGLAEGGMLHTIELRKEDAKISQDFFSKSLYNNQIVLHQGNALDIIPRLTETWDIVFIDADKVNYINYYELTLPFVKKNGVIIADNVLFHGDVLEEKITGKNAIAIHAFNKHVAKDPRIEHVMITIRDGISIIRKL